MRRVSLERPKGVSVAEYADSTEIFLCLLKKITEILVDSF
jgi:hypothetical protein